MLALLIACFGLASTTSFAQSWDWGSKKTISGEGAVVTKNISLDDFQSIGLSIKAKVIVKKGSQQSISIEAQQNIIDQIQKEVKNGSWEITFGNNVRARDFKDVTINITIPTIKALSIAGAGDIVTADAFDGLDEVKLSIAGAGDIEFLGSANSAKVSIAGSGDVQAEKFTVKDCKVSIAGSGSCYVDVSGELKASIAGSGDVKYKGSPKVSISAAGSGRVTSMEN